MLSIKPVAPQMFKIHKPFIWLFIGIAVRLLLFLYQTEFSDTISNNGLWGHITGDTPSYIEPVEHLLKHGTYAPDFRMPGYGFIYYILRLIFSTVIACNVLVLIQPILSGAAIYFLALTAFQISNSKKVFIAVYILSLLTTYNAVYDSYLLTESFCTSAGIFAFYFLIIGLKRNACYPFLLSGLFFTWMIFLRPVYAGLFVIVLILLIIASFSKKSNINTSLSRKPIIYFLIPFILADCLWTTRNYTQHHKLNILTNPFFAPVKEKEYPHALTTFLQSWGGTHSVWRPHGHNLWFEGDSLEQKNISFPTYLLNGSITMDSLDIVRNYIIASNNSSFSFLEKKKNDILATSALNRFTQYVNHEQPIIYYIYTPLHYARLFYADAGTYLLFHKSLHELYFFEKLVFIFIALLYYSILATSAFAAFIFIFKNKKYPFFYIIPAIIAVYTFIIFPFVLRMPETRFMVPAFPFLIMCSVLFIDRNLFQYKKIFKFILLINKPDK